MELSERLRTKAYELGTGDVGFCAVDALSKNAITLNTMLPGCRSVVCIIVPHSTTALDSSDIYLKQYDTIFCYDEVARISHRLARYLETEGYKAVAVPAFLPLDMSDGKMGMIGAIDWKQAAVESNLAAWGKSGLVVSSRFGPRIRIGGLITTAVIKPDEKLTVSPCADCRICIESCPAQALLGDGRINKSRCGEYIFSYGLRTFTRLLRDVGTATNEAEVKSRIYNHRTRELWQALETGNYYYCWNCQSCCPIGKKS